MNKFVLSFVFLGFAQVSFGADFSKSTPALIEKGKAVYTTNCATCHGDKGDGKGPAGAYMKPAPRNFATDKFVKGDKPKAVFEVISKGLAGTAMTGYGHLSEEDRWAVTHYTLSFRAKK